jgi:hypothetical protein
VSDVLGSAYWRKRTTGSIRAYHPTSGKLITVDPQRDAVIREDLTKEWHRYPATYHWYCALRDTAKDRLRQAEHVEQQMHAKAYFAAGKEGKPTETARKHYTRQDTQALEATQARIEAERILDGLESAVLTIYEKRWSLQQLSKLQSQDKDYNEGINR